MPSSDQSSGASKYTHTATDVWQSLSRGEHVRIVTLNPEIVSRCHEEPQYAEAVSSMTHRMVDGIGLALPLLLHHILHGISERIERIPGATFAEDIAAYCASENLRLALVGGKTEAAEAYAKTLQSHYKNLHVCFCEHGGEIHRDGTPEDKALIKRISESKPDILFVGFGAPKQEFFISKYAETVGAKLCIGLGGTFDFSAHKPRAPKIIQKLGLEWLYRSLHEKGHFKRVLALFVKTAKLSIRLLRAQPSGSRWLLP